MAIINASNFRFPEGFDIGPIVGALPYVELDENSLYYSSYVISGEGSIFDSGTRYLIQFDYYGDYDLSTEDSILNSTVSGINIASYSYGAYSIYDLNFTLKDFLDPSSFGFKLLSDNDVVYGSRFNDIIDTYLGNDYINRSLGNDYINGSEGIDTFDLGANVASFSIDLSASGQLQFSRNDAPLSTSTVESIELFEFGPDGTFSRDEVLRWASQPDYQFVEGIHRFYNLNSGVHFYTDSELEFDNITGNPQWRYQYEGVAYQPADSGTRLYRFYNSEKGYHFMTSNSDEAAILTYNTSSGYNYEGRSYVVSTDKTDSASTEVHRFYQPDKGVHFYSSSELEANIVIANSIGQGYSLENAAGIDNLLFGGWGYIYEGVAWYV